MIVMKRFMTVEEVAKELRVSTDTILRYIKNRELIAHKVGVQYRIEAEEYQRFLDTLRTDNTEQDNLTQED